MNGHVPKPYGYVTNATPHFCVRQAYQALPIPWTEGNKVMRTSSFKIAVIEYEGSLPKRIDPRLKNVKRIIKIWNYVPFGVARYVIDEANELADRLEQLWPCQLLNKDYRNAPVLGALREIKYKRKPRPKKPKESHETHKEE